jgi:hypothetical protein
VRYKRLGADPRTDFILERATAFYRETLKLKRMSHSTIIRRALDGLLAHLEGLEKHLEPLTPGQRFQDEGAGLERWMIKQAQTVRLAPTQEAEKLERSKVAHKTIPLPWLEEWEQPTADEEARHEGA